MKSLRNQLARWLVAMALIATVTAAGRLLHLNQGTAGFASANGGTLGLLPRAGGGTIARIDLPAARLPMMPAEEPAVQAEHA